MNKEIFYVLFDDHIVTRQEVEMAFYVTHGYYSHRHEKKFLKWLRSLLGKTIKQAIPEQDMEVEKLAAYRPILAMRLYRNRNNCTLGEAREYVENLQNKS